MGCAKILTFFSLFFMYTLQFVDILNKRIIFFTIPFLLYSNILNFFFFFLSETKKIILIKEQIQERKKRQKKEKKTKGRMKGPSYTKTKEKHPTIEL